MSSDFGLNSQWPIVPLADVVYFQEGPGLRNWQYRDEGVPFVNIRCIKDGRLLRGEMTCLDPDEVEQKYKHFMLDAGDFVVSSSGTLGRLAEVQTQDLPCMLNTSVIRFRPLNSDNLDRRYLRYFLSSSLFEQQILAFANGSAQLNYGPSHLKRMGIVVPPIATQQAIGKILGTLDDRITLLRETNATLEAIAQALFKSWFVDFDPVRAKMEGRAPEGMDEATAALFPDSFEETELGMVPRGWRVGKFADFIQRIPVGKKFDQKSANVAGNIPILDQGKSGVIGFHDEVPGVRASLDSPVVVFANHTCYMRLISFDFSAIQNVLPFVGKDVDTVWAFYATKDRLKFSEYKGHWPDFVIEYASIPPKSLTLAFRATVDPLVRAMRNNDLQAQAISNVRDALLPRLISGHLLAT